MIGYQTYLRWEGMGGVIQRTILVSEAKKQLKRVIRRLLSLLRKPPPANVRKKKQEWSIGIYTGESPLNLSPHENADNPVLTCEDVSDVPAAFVADPFMLRVDSIWHMFFEVMNRQTGKGEIGLAVSSNGLEWTYRQIVLAEPFHLSYPYVFKRLGSYYMIPESYQDGSIRLYRALTFPTQWLFVGTLLSGRTFLDSSIFYYDNKWWLFTETNPDLKGGTLRLYCADDLVGRWYEHPESPIIEGNAHIARPAGRVLITRNRIVRYTQDCYPVYGTQVRAFEITELTNTSYRERELEADLILKPSGAGWNESGMHHIDPHFTDDGQWIACVDGFFWHEV